MEKKIGMAIVSLVTAASLTGCGTSGLTEGTQGTAIKDIRVTNFNANVYGPKPSCDIHTGQLVTVGDLEPMYDGTPMINLSAEGCSGATEDTPEIRDALGIE